MDFIDHVDGGDVYMDDKNIYPISARKIAEISQQIKDYQFSTR